MKKKSVLYHVIVFSCDLGANQLSQWFFSFVTIVWKFCFISKWGNVCGAFYLVSWECQCREILPPSLLLLCFLELCLEFLYYVRDYVSCGVSFIGISFYWCPRVGKWFHDVVLLYLLFYLILFKSNIIDFNQILHHIFY